MCLCWIVYIQYSSLNRMICSSPEIIGCVAQLVDHWIPDQKGMSSSLVTFKKFLLLVNQLHCCIIGLLIFALVAGGLRRAMISIHLLIYIHNHNKSNSVSLKWYFAHVLAGTGLVCTDSRSWYWYWYWSWYCCTVTLCTICVYICVVL
jgi:hypothetical protein